MESENIRNGFDLDQLTKRAVRSFWMDGLWEIACAGIFLIIGLWGIVYVRYLAFPPRTWHFQLNLGKHIIWIGLVALVLVLGIYTTVAWFLVKLLKRRWVSPYIGRVEHKFFFPTDPKVFKWYGALYIVGLGMLYGIFIWIKGGAYVLSVPFIISPAAILWGIGQVYDIYRYKVAAFSGFTISLLLELLLTTQADYMQGPANVLQVLPQWGTPFLPCLVWSVLLIVSGLIGLASIRRIRDGE